MKRILILCLIIASCTVLAQTNKTTITSTSTTANLIDPAGTAWGIPSTQVLPNGQISQLEAVGPTTGTAYYNSSTNTIRFSYFPSTVAQTIAINQALSGSGIQINGFNWHYQWMNGGQFSGSLNSVIAITGSSGQVVESYQFNHPIQPTETWNVESGTKTFNNPYALASLGNISMSFSGQDNKFWNGLYGPRVRDPSLSLSYTVDPCASDPLSSTTCAGYAQAYFTQQCSPNPLYNAQCSGYAQAYFTQQCSSNPLYNAQCVGYTQAYFDQQCSINPLYSTLCPGYTQAYFDQQCSLNGLYDRNCPNYNTAYVKSQLTTTTASTPTVSSTDSTVSIVISNDANNTTSQSSPTSVTSNISVIAPQQNLSAPVTPVQSAIISVSVPVIPTQAQQQERQQDQKKTEGTVATVERKAGGDKKEMAKQVATVAKDAVERAKKAQTLEAQAANQGLVVGLMGYVAGFGAYQNVTVPDTNHLQMTKQYNKPNVDNRNAQRRLSGANEIKWQEMVDSQYNKGN